MPDLLWCLQGETVPACRRESDGPFTLPGYDDLGWELDELFKEFDWSDRKVKDAILSGPPSLTVPLHHKCADRRQRCWASALCPSLCILTPYLQSRHAGAGDNLPGERRGDVGGSEIKRRPGWKRGTERGHASPSIVNGSSGRG